MNSMITKRSQDITEIIQKTLFVGPEGEVIFILINIFIFYNNYIFF